MKHFRLVDGHGGVIDAQSFRTTDEAHAWPPLIPARSWDVDSRGTGGRRLAGTARTRRRVTGVLRLSV